MVGQRVGCGAPRHEAAGRLGFRHQVGMAAARRLGICNLEIRYRHGRDGWV